MREKGECRREEGRREEERRFEERAAEKRGERRRGKNGGEGRRANGIIPISPIRAALHAVSGHSLYPHRAERHPLTLPLIRFQILVPVPHENFSRVGARSV